jgi:hypothetical protein
MNNFLKGLGLLSPLIIAVIGMCIFCFCDPRMITIFRVEFEIFCGIIGVLALFLSVVIIAWGVKNALLHIFKVKIKS